MHVLQSLLDDIKDAHPDFDQDEYCGGFLYPLFGTPSCDEEHTDATFHSWFREAKAFLSCVLTETCKLQENLHILKDSEIASKGFMHTLVKSFSVESFFLDSKICCNQVLNEIRNTSAITFRTHRTVLFRSAIKATSALLDLIVLDYARIADRHLQILKLECATEGDESRVTKTVECVQQVLDRRGSVFNDKERKELNRMLYNAARKYGIVPSKFYIKNVERLGEHRFGGGAYGDVYKAQIDHRLVVVKVSRFFWDQDERERMHRDLCKEAVIWKCLNHPHILPFYGLCREGFPSIGLISPFMQNGDVLAYLKRKVHMDKKELMSQICSGITYMHCNEPRVIHGDLKCANVLIDDNENVRIADFGLSRLTGIATLTASNGGRGTLRWQAPELIHPSEYGGDGRPNVKTDVYAFGMTCLEILTGKAPFHGISDWEVIKMTGNGTGLECALTAAQGSEYLVQILESCCSTKPDSRLEMQDIADKIFPSRSLGKYGSNF